MVSVSRGSLVLLPVPNKLFSAQLDLRPVINSVPHIGVLGCKIADSFTNLFMFVLKSFGEIPQQNLLCDGTVLIADDSNATNFNNSYINDVSDPVYKVCRAGYFFHPYIGISGASQCSSIDPLLFVVFIIDLPSFLNCDKKL